MKLSRLNQSMNPNLFVIFILASILCSLSLTAQTVVTEVFDYAEGSLSELGAAENGWEGPWEAVSAGFIEVVPQTDYDHPIVEESGKAIELLEGGTIFRNLAETWLDEGNEYWISFLHQRIDDNPPTECYGGLSLFLDGSELLYMGKPWAGANVGLDGSGVEFDTSATLATEFVWVVVKLIMTGDAENDLAVLWVNPEMGVEPDTANADAKAHWRGSNGFNRIRLGSGNAPNSENVMFDEIMIGHSSPTVESGVRDAGVASVPGEFILEQNYPNPFNPATTIQFELARNSDIRLDITNVAGETVLTLLNRPMSAGNHRIVWNGENAQGQTVPGGVYLCRLQTGTTTRTIRMLMVK